MNNESMDLADRRILDIIQTGFPLVQRPYAAIGDQLGMAEKDVFERVSAMRKSKLIRRLGANFQSAKLGYRSTLCGASVPPGKLEAFIELVNALPGVTHNYLRDHHFNVWFTLIGPSWESVCADIKRIEDQTGVQVMNLPAAKLYKIRVDFQME